MVGTEDMIQVRQGLNARRRSPAFSAGPAFVSRALLQSSLSQTRSWHDAGGPDRWWKNMLLPLATSSAALLVFVGLQVWEAQPCELQGFRGLGDFGGKNFRAWGSGAL